MKNQYDVKPCPFCGCYAVADEIDIDEPVDLLYVIRCSNPTCICSSLKRTYDDLDYAIYCWNKRSRRNPLSCDEKGYPIKEKQEDN